MNLKIKANLSLTEEGEYIAIPTNMDAENIQLSFLLTELMNDIKPDEISRPEWNRHKITLKVFIEEARTTARINSKLN